MNTYEVTLILSDGRKVVIATNIEAGSQAEAIKEATASFTYHCVLVKPTRS